MTEIELHLLHREFSTGNYDWRDTYANTKKGTVNGWQREWRGYIIQIILTDDHTNLPKSTMSWGLWRRDDESNAIMGQKLLTDLPTAIAVAFAKWATASGTASDTEVQSWWSKRQTLRDECDKILKCGPQKYSSRQIPLFPDAMTDVEEL